MAADPLRLRTQFERMLSTRRTYEPTWQLLGDYVLPRKNDITTTQTPGVKRTDKLFDSSGPHDAELLRSSLAGALMPPMLKWFSLVMRDDALNALKPVRDYLTFVRDRTLKALSQSNFASEILEVLHDLSVFGTGAMLQEAGPPGYLGKFGGFRFRALNAREYVIGEDPFGRVDDLRRLYEMTASQILKRWFDNSTEATGIPEDVKQAMQQDKPDQVFQVLHSCYPRMNRAPARHSNRNMPWASCYQMYGPKNELLEEGGFEEMPFLVPRWSKASGETYGYGPAHTALPDIRSLNRAIELYLAAAGKAVDPTILVDDDSLVSTLTLEPAGAVVRRPDTKIEVLESKARFDVAEHLNERLERKIAEVFFLDALRLRFKPNMTATEVMALQDEMLRLLGPTAGRLHSELIGPIIERSIGILNRAGELPPPPDVLLQEGGDIDIQYEGPLARASKSADLNAIDRVQAYRERIAQSTGRPDIYDVYDLDGEAAHYAVNGGYPAPFVRDADGIAQLRQARVQAQEQQAQMAQMEQVAGAAGKAAPMLKVMQDATQPPEAAA